MILWNTVLSDPDQLDLTRYLQKLRPMDKAADILALQRRITPALLKAMMADADANLPENMLFVQFKTDRKSQTGRTRTTQVDTVSKFSTWAMPLLHLTETESALLEITETGDVISYRIDPEYATVSHLRLLPPAANAGVIVQQLIGLSNSETSEVRMMQTVEANTLQLGYLFNAMYKLGLKLPMPEGGPTPHIRTRPTPMNRLLTGNTPNAVKEVFTTLS